MEREHDNSSTSSRLDFSLQEQGAVGLIDFCYLSNALISLQLSQINSAGLSIKTTDSPKVISFFPKAATGVAGFDASLSFACEDQSIFWRCISSAHCPTV